MAVNLASSTPLCIITGGPGTGKTTTMREVVKELRRRGLSYLLVAPTGKAASRLSEQVGDSASTIHRAIGWRPSGEPIHGPSYPLECDAVIVDECSMIDALLFSRLLGCISPETSLVLVGDDAQLPPIRAGNPFRDLLQTHAVPTIRLSAIFRQGEGSPIAEAAAAISRGEVPESKQRGDSAFYWITVDHEERIPRTVEKIVSERFPNHFGIRGDDSIQVLCPGKEGPVSTESLNDLLAAIFNPTTGGRGALKVGHKVINTRNDYDLDVFNGELGHVLSVGKHVKVDHGDREVIYSGSVPISGLLRAWALTVHRSQGSEYKAVVIALSERHTKLLSRNLLYTAVTRAAQVCVVISTERAQRLSLGTVVDNTRTTTLEKRIRSLLAAT